MLADSEFAGITIDVAPSTITYSSCSAVLEFPSAYSSNGIVISKGVISESVAVKVTSTSEFSVIVSEDKAYVISGASSLSRIVISNSEFSLINAFVGVCKTALIISLGSKELSLIVFIVRDPDVNPASIFITGLKL